MRHSYNLNGRIKRWLIIPNGIPKQVYLQRLFQKHPTLENDYILRVVTPRAHLKPRRGYKGFIYDKRLVDEGRISLREICDRLGIEGFYYFAVTV